MPPADLTIAICTHNPRRDVLRRTLDSLRAQVAPDPRLELLIIDNASNPPLAIGPPGLGGRPARARVA